MAEGEGGAGSFGRGWILPKTEVVIPEKWTKSYVFGLIRREVRVTGADVRDTCDKFRAGTYKNALELYLEDGSHVVTDAVVRKRLYESKITEAEVYDIGSNRLCC